MLQDAREACIRQLVDPSEKRKTSEPDDFLRGRVDTIDALLSFGPGLIAEFDADRERLEDARKLEQQ